MAKNWAICIGINQYHFLQDLTCAVNDAEKIHLWLTETARFDQAYLFTDHSPPITDMSEPLPSQPTFTTLRYLFRKYVARPILSPSDSLWFFFSGHGVREQGQDYLLLSDSDPDPEEVNNSAISLAFITECLRRSGAGNIMMFIDACRSVAKSGLGIELQPTQGVISIASCGPTERSYEIETLNHGSFTYALLESLQIQGENNCATVERLCKRLKDRVGELNRTHDKPRQTPYARIEPETKNHLIFLPERIQPTFQDIATLRENALKAEIKNDLKLAEVLWTRLVIYDLEEALESLLRIRQKLQQPGLNGTVSLPSEPVQTSPAKSLELSPSLSPEVLTIDLPHHIQLELIKIPAGSFMMGTPKAEVKRLNQEYSTDWYNCELPQHRVTLRAFYLGKYPVTQEQYQAVMGNNPSHFQDNSRNPVECVSWDDAQAFCQKLKEITGEDFRLPTEAEWEYACRAGTQTRYYFGDDEKQLEEYAWYADNSGKNSLNSQKLWRDEPDWSKYWAKLEKNGCQTHPVGEKKPNDWGLYDMHGNVWEWCEDSWHDSYADKPQNIKDNGNAIWLNSNEASRVLRGGSWDNDSRNCRSAIRGRLDADGRNDSIGFRLVLLSF